MPHQIRFVKLAAVNGDLLLHLLTSFCRSLLTTGLALWPVWTFCVFILAARIVWRIYQIALLSRSGIHDIDRMDGRTFEHYLRAVFARQGYQVELTRYVGDYGADLILRSGGTKTVVQAKRWRRRVGIRAVQEVVAAKGYYGCTDAMVLTNSYYTFQAKLLARRNGVCLWSRNELIAHLLEAGGRETNSDEPTPPPPADSMPPTPPHRASCIVCGKEVSTKVKAFCESNSPRFGGQIYCFDHQQLIR